MAAPPVVTAGAAASLASPRMIPLGNNARIGFPTNISLGAAPFAAVSDKVTWTRGAAVAVSTFETRFNNNTLQAGLQNGSGGFSFICDDSDFELIFTGASGQFVILVDDEYVTLTPVTCAASGVSYHKYAFGSRARRRIDVRGYNLRPRAININQSGSIQPAPIRGPRVAALTDSFGLGQGASGWGANNWCAALQDYLGWDDVWPFGVGSTGFLANNGGVGYTFRQRLQMDIAPYGSTFDILIIQGSTNDTNGGFTPAQISAEAALLYAEAKAVCPNARIYHAPTAFQGVGTMTANELGIIAAQKAAAAAAGVTFINPLELPLTGTIAPAGTLRAAVAAAGGGGGFNVYGAPLIEGTIEIVDPDPTKIERVHIKDTQMGGTDGGGAWYFTTPVNVFRYAHAAGVPWKLVGSSYLTGSGRVGTTTGFGNCDVLTGADLHPTDLGHVALGETIAELMLRAGV